MNLKQCNFRIQFILALSGLIFFVQGCELFKQQPTVDYSRVTVSEEGGVNFTKYSDEEDNVVSPNISKDEENEILRWYAPPMIATSNDGENLAFLRRKNGFTNLFVKSVEGGGASVQRTFNKDVLDMAFSPDGEYIAFSEKRSDGNLNIKMIKAQGGSAIQQITNSPAMEVGPEFSKNGESLYFTKKEGNKFYIWNINLETSLLTQYSEGFTPALSPDGKKLVVTRNNNQTKRGEIWTINLKSGTETEILSNKEKGFSSPVFSPDGKHLLVVGTTMESETRPQNLDIYSIRIDGTGLRQLTYHGGHDVSPQWSADGDHIFFISQRGNTDGSSNIWRMDFEPY